MRENRTPGSVRGLSGNWQSYRDQLPLDANGGRAEFLPNVLSHCCGQPSVDNLRNFLLMPTTEMLSFFQQLREAL